LNPDISQGSVVSYLTCGGILKNKFVANLPLSLSAKEQAKMPKTGMPNAGPECRTPECRIRSAGMPNLLNALNGIPFNELAS